MLKTPKKAPPPAGLAPHQAQFILTLLLIMAAFAIGVLWTKVQFYEKGGSGNQPTTAAQKQAAQESPLSTNSLKKYARELKLDQNKFAACLDGGQYKNDVNADVTYGSTLKVSGTPAFFVNGKFLGGAFPFDSFKEIIDKELGGTASANYKDYSPTLQQAYERPNRAFDPVPKTVELGNAQTQGSKDAKVVIVEFSDFECPYCGSFFSQTYPEIKKQYIDTGKVYFVYKHFPLTQIHPNAQAAAEASLCAAEQGKFWEYHDQLFNAQRN